MISAVRWSTTKRSSEVTGRSVTPLTVFYRCAFRLLGKVADAEDALQECGCGVVQCADGYSGKPG
jgi:hypothetical protein